MVPHPPPETPVADDDVSELREKVRKLTRAVKDHESAHAAAQKLLDTQARELQKLKAEKDRSASQFSKQEAARQEDHEAELEKQVKERDARIEKLEKRLQKERADALGLKRDSDLAKTALIEQRGEVESLRQSVGEKSKLENILVKL